MLKKIMKKKSLITLFTIIWFSLTQSTKIIAENLLKPNSFSIKNELKSSKERENPVMFEKENSKETNEKLSHLINELNKIKVYILVTTTLESKGEDVFLSLTSESRLDGEQVLINYRHQKLILTRPYSARRPKASKKNRFSLIHLLRSNELSGVSRLYRNGKSYSTENTFGYKSICPIFFDRYTAENFLLKSTPRSAIIYNHLPLGSKKEKELRNGVLNTKIKSVPLGDLFAYLTTQENSHTFEKLEFLFIPYLSKINNLTLAERLQIKKFIRGKNFTFYQKEFLALKKVAETFEEI
jgi:hypothetical protein